MQVLSTVWLETDTLPDLRTSYVPESPAQVQIKYTDCPLYIYHT
jgi:hypothetical protein